MTDTDTAAVPQVRTPEASHHPTTCAGTACPCYQQGTTEAVQALGAVERGSVVVLRGAQPEPDQLAQELAKAAGHHQFVVVYLPSSASLDVVHDPLAVADLLGLARPNPPGFPYVHPPQLPHPQVPDLVERLDTSLAAARDWLATHPEAERSALDVLADQEDEAASDPWRGTPGLSDAD